MAQSQESRLGERRLTNKLSKVLYVGIDVSKKTLDIAITVEGKEIKASKKGNNNLGGCRLLEQWTRTQCQKHGCERIHYVLESTGIYSDRVVEYLHQREDLKISVINPFQAKSWGKSIGVRIKTDKVDSQLLALYAAAIKPEPTAQMNKELKALRSLVRYLEYLISLRGQEMGHLESVTNPVVASSIKKTISSYDKRIKEIEKAIEDHIKKHPGLKEKTELLKSTTGIGDITSKILLCELHLEDGGVRLSAKAQRAHAGLAPEHRVSGSSVRGKPHISRVGNSRLRRCLYFPAIVAIKHNPVISEFYNRLRQRGKPKMVASVAAMRELLVIAVGVLNNQTAFDVNWSTQRKYA
ncbi:MAG: IS110 family transposase [Ignavibacteriales bacterium]